MRTDMSSRHATVVSFKLLSTLQINTFIEVRLSFKVHWVLSGVRVVTLLVCLPNWRALSLTKTEMKRQQVSDPMVSWNLMCQCSV